MKVAILGDPHFGSRSDNLLFLQHFLRFYDEVFFPYLEKNKIDTVICLGDLFDRRKYININTLNTFRERIIKKSQEMGIQWHILLGNHDIYYKNTIAVSSVKEVLETEEGFTVYDIPKDLTLDSYTFGIVPWITPENRQECLDFIQNTKARTLCGHFEIAGFYMNTVTKCDSGLDLKMFKRFEHVLSGHFHKKQKKGNIQYTGTPYQFTFGDLGETKGFHIFDTDTEKMRFVKNPNSIFWKVVYDDKEHVYDVENDDFSQFKDCYIRIVCVKKTRPKQFDRLIEKMYDAGVANVTIVDTQVDDVDLTGEEKLDMSLDTIEIINTEIDDLDIEIDKEKLKKILNEMYLEALNS